MEQLTQKEVIIFLKDNKKILKTRFYCTKIGLFGSFARNEQTEDSDIDIIVDFDKNTPDLYMTEIELKKFISNRFNRKVDVCAEKWIKSIFKTLILKEVIYA